MKALLIYNPKSGVKKRDEYDRILSYLKEESIDYDLHETLPDFGPYEILEMLKDHRDDYDVIISSGGDGTISHTVHGMHCHEFHCPLLILPTGTTNEIAQNLHIDELELEDILARLHAMKTKKFDYGQVDRKQTFVYALTFGNFTEVTYRTPQKMKNWLGYRAYVLYGFVTFRKIHSYHIAVKTPNLNFSGEYVFGAISNSKSMGNIFHFDPETYALDDGEFEVLFIKKPRSVKDLRQILHGMIQNDYSGKMFVTFKASELSIRSSKPIAWNIDGEYGGDKKTIEIKNRHQSIELVI